MSIQFNSRFETIGEMPDIYSDGHIKNELMFFSSDYNFVKSCCRGIYSPTALFIEYVKTLWGENFILDSRVHMLMEGWYPCIPGWHLDDVPRSRADGQPNHHSPEYQSEHIMAVIGNSSLTHFAIGDIVLDEPPLGTVVYGKWHKEIDQNISQGKLKEVQVPNLSIAKFNWQSFHKGVAATKNGWRWFARASRNTNRKVTNEIRSQVQVYLSDPNVGW